MDVTKPVDDKSDKMSFSPCSLISVHSLGDIDFPSSLPEYKANVGAKAVLGFSYSPVGLMSGQTRAEFRRVQWEGAEVTHSQGRFYEAITQVNGPPTCSVRKLTSKLPASGENGCALLLSEPRHLSVNKESLFDSVFTFAAPGT